VKTPDQIGDEIVSQWNKIGPNRYTILANAIAAAIQAERDHWTSESNLPRVEEVQGAFREAKLLERIAELEKGLEPFARAIDLDSALWLLGCDDNELSIRSDTHITIGHCRRAAELLKTKGVTDTPSAIRPTPENTLQKNP
jgi:hypothetical protein